MKRHIIWLGAVLALALCGCGTSDGDESGNPVDVSDADEGPVDVSDADERPWDVSDSDEGHVDGDEVGSERCRTPLTGSGPLGVKLEGIAHLVRERGESLEATVTMDLYLPQGRQPGAPVLLTKTVQYPVAGTFATESTLDDNLSATLGWGGFAYTMQMGVSGLLVGPDDGLSANVFMNLASAGNDVADIAEGPAKLCPVGSLPEPELQGPRRFGPLSVLSFAASAPLDVALENVMVTVAGEPIDVEITFDGGVRIGPARAFPPGRQVSVDFDDIRDVLGRSVAVSSDLQPHTTTAVLTDLTFDSPPPEGAIVSFSGAGVRDGALTFAEGEVLLALPDPGAATTLRIMASSSRGECDRVHAALIDDDGNFEQGDAYASREPFTVNVLLPPGRPLWLNLWNDVCPPLPQNYCGLWGCTVSVSEIAFE